MLNKFSWQGYWSFIVLVLVVYYVVIYFLYFRKHIRLKSTRPSIGLNSILKGADISGLADEHPVSNFQNGQPKVEMPQAGDEEQAMYHCMDELNAFFENARKAKGLKNDMIRSVRAILSRYPSLNYSVYKESINSIIKTEIEMQCSIHLGAEELRKVWKG